MRLTNLLKMFFGMFTMYSMLGEGGGAQEEGEAEAAEDEGAQEEGGDLVSEGWLKGSQANFANDPIMANVKDVPTLVQNYINAQRMVGKKGHILPDSNSGEDSWNEFYTKMGRPVDAAGYELKSEKLNEQFIDGFAAEAHKAGLLPQQAQALMSYYNRTAEQESEEELQARSGSEEESIEALKGEWGEGYQTKLHKAQTVAAQFGGEEFIASLEAQGLGNDVGVIKFLANIGESLNEDNFEPSAVSQFHMTPEQAQAEIDGIMDSSESPYWKPEHQDHFKVKQKVEKLYKIIS